MTRIKNNLIIACLLIIGANFLMQGGLEYLSKTLDTSHFGQISNFSPDYNQGEDLLPDLVPFAVSDMRLSYLSGRRVLRFSAIIVNSGKAPLELRGDPKVSSTGDYYQDVYQRITRADGTVYNKTVGNFYWHQPHDHYHYSDFADYILEEIKPGSDTSLIMTKPLQQKTTFCLRDNKLVAPNLPGAPAVKVFATCGADLQGISIGWTDIYEYTLPDQYLDVNDLPAGIYELFFYVDPRQRFSENHKDNNTSIVIIRLNPKAGVVETILSGSPFNSSANSALNGTLIRGSGEEIYVMHNNKRRWLRSMDIFNSYNYSWDSVYSVPQGVVIGFSINNLVRLKGGIDVYALNDLGYKRHIRNPDIFSSYGFSFADVADVSPEEFAAYPETNLIMRVGDSSVYLISGSTKKNIGTVNFLNSLGYNADLIQIINQVDFDTYVTIN